MQIALKRVGTLKSTRGARMAGALAASAACCSAIESAWIGRYARCEEASDDGGKESGRLTRSAGLASILFDHLKNRATGDRKILFGQEIGVGFALGISSGFAVKKAARTLLFTVRSQDVPNVPHVSFAA